MKAREESRMKKKTLDNFCALENGISTSILPEVNDLKSLFNQHSTPESAEFIE